VQLPTFIALAQVHPNAQAFGQMHGVRSSSDQVISIFWCQILQMVRTYSSRFVFYRDLLCRWQRP